MHYYVFQELCVIENNKRMLTERCQTAWEKINRMKEVQFQLNLDLNDKSEVLETDQEMLKLHKDCANISFKPDSLRVHKR